jgi:hypothetical protein
VQAHPDPQHHPIGPPLGSKGPLRGHHRRHRVAGLGEADEERVTLRADLMAVVLAERRPKELPVFGQDLDLPAP